MCSFKSPKHNPTNLEEILAKFSIYNRYHLQILILAILAFTSNCMYCSNYVFVAETVEYRCSKELNNSYNYSDDSCTEWVYENPNTFVAEFQLANQEWKRTLVGTIHSFGYMVGLLFVGPLSDKLGRKHMIVVTGVLGGVFGVAKSFSPWYWLYIAFEFLESAIGDICSPTFILMTEIISMNYRIKYIIIAFSGYFLGGIISSLVAYWTQYWRTYLRIVYGPALLFFFYKYLLDESPRWLLIKGERKKAIDTLRKASQIARITLDRDVLENLSSDNGNETKFADVLKITFKSHLLRVRLFICLVWWTTSTFVSYGLIVNTVSLQGNKYLNFALISCVELPGIFIIIFLLTRCKRKLPLMCCFFAAAVLCISQPFMPLNLPWLSILIYMLGKLMTNLYFNITYLYTSELFPTYTRNSMHAFCSSVGRIGSIIAPQTPLLISYWYGLPSLVFGVASLIAGTLTFFVPDISNDALPDTVKQAEQLGSSNSPDAFSKIPKSGTYVTTYQHDV